MNILKLFCLLSVSLCCAEESTLELVQVIFRHGARTPVQECVYPNDPYSDVLNFWPYEFGQITAMGMESSYELGQVLRRRYNAFLGSIYYPQIVKAQSTNYSRTKSTLLLVLAGLFKDIVPQKIPNDCFQPDYWFALPIPYCPKAAELVQLNYKSGTSHRIMEKHKDLIEYIETNSGLQNISNIFGLYNLYQTLWAEETFGLTLPDWTKKVYPEFLKYVAVQNLAMDHTKELTRLDSGRQLQVFINTIQHKLNNTLPHGRKIYLYSGHEYSVVSTLAAMNLFKPHFPYYNAAVMVELHYLQKQQTYAVRVLYQPNVDATPEELRLDGCDVFCPVDTFFALTRSNIPTNFTEECKSDIDLDKIALTY